MGGKEEKGRGNSNLPAASGDSVGSSVCTPQFKRVCAYPLCILQVATFEAGRTAHLSDSCAHSQLRHEVA